MSSKVIVKLHHKSEWFEAYIFAGRWHITVDGLMKQVHEECVESWQYLIASDNKKKIINKENKQDLEETQDSDRWIHRLEKEANSEWAKNIKQTAWYQALLDMRKCTEKCKEALAIEEQKRLKTKGDVVRQCHEDVIQSIKDANVIIDEKHKEDFKKEALAKARKYQEKNLEDIRNRVQLLGDQNPGQALADAYLHQQNLDRQMKKGDL